MIDPDADRSKYLQIADEIREQIAIGKLRRGQRIPSYNYLAQEYDVALNTVRQAVNVLRRESLLVVRGAAGTFVRDPGKPKRIILNAGEEVTVRIPTNAERREHDLAEGVLALVVTRTDGTEEIHPADLTRVVGWSTGPDKP
jgi:DNA-binding transcriptional regulator YhcF (GntR family)